MLKKLLLIIFILMITGFTALLIQQNVRTNRERSTLTTPGERVETDHGEVHVHTFGEGPPLVFLSGLGTTAPLYDFKPLWDNLKDDYTIIILEQPGYGYNQSISSDKSLDAMTTMYRQALNETTIEGPYTLIAHSMSGLIATYWSWYYSEEILQIIGLDITIAPMVLDIIEPPTSIEITMQWLVGRLGIARFMDEDDLTNVLPLLNVDGFNDSEQTNIKTLFFANLFNRNVVREARALQANAETMDETPRPYLTPTLLILSQDNLDHHPEALDVFTSYFEPFNVYEQHTLDTHHYVHHEKAETITNLTKTFSDTSHD